MLVEAVTTAFNTIGNIFNGVAALLRGDFAGAWTATKQLVSDVVRGMLNVLDTIVPGAKAAITKLTSGFASWFGSLATQMVGYGRDIIAGLVKGILASPQAVWNALKSVATGAVKTFADAIKSKSPSLVFAELGGFITAGLAQSILGGIDAVRGAMGALGKAVGETELPDVGTPDTGDGDTDPTAPTEATAQSWRDGFRNWLKDGVRAALDGDLGGFLESWIKGIGERVLDSLIDTMGDALDQLLGGLFGGGDGGILGGLFGGGGGLGSLFGNFAGGFDGGGTIPMGQWGMTGERGPEPIMATPRGVVVRPNRTLGDLRPAGPQISVSIPIDATGADAAALGRVQASVDRLRADLPSTIVSTMQDAGERGIVNTGAWR